jgi:hypothetical protein
MEKKFCGLDLLFQKIYRVTVVLESCDVSISFYVTVQSSVPLHYIRQLSFIATAVKTGLSQGERNSRL